jgi:hypothetical protein
MWRIKNFFKNICRVFIWIPVIWKDRDYDGYYMLKIIRMKLITMEKSHSKCDMFTRSEDDVKWMKLCIKLIDNIVNSVYWKYKYDDKPPSTNGMDNYYRDLLIKYKSMKFDTNTFLSTSKYYGDYWSHKAERLLFKILMWRNQIWWD